MKRQLLELLSAAGFVLPGLRSKVVENLGKHEGNGSDGCRLALSGALGPNHGKGNWR